MTDDEANELLRNNDWCKWSDARELLQTAAHMGAMAERERCARIVETQDTNGDHVGGWFELLAAKIRA